MIIEVCLNFFSIGGVMRRARGEVKALLNAGHRVVVITDLKNVYKEYLDEFNELRDKLHILPIRPFYLHPKPIRKISLRIISRDLSFAILCYKALTTLSKKESIDLIISHGATQCYGVAHFAQIKNIPSAWVIHELISDNIATNSNPYNWFTTQMYKHSNHYAFSKMHYIIAVSDYIKKLAILEGAKPKNTYTKHNFVDTHTFHPDSKIIKDIDVLFIGRLSVEKGVDILIKAAQYLSKDRRILIIGDGELRRNLEYQAQLVDCDIKFLGWVEHNLIPQFIQSAKILAAPSLSEAHAIVPLEAMACGVPVIGTTQAGGMPETITHNKNGWLLKKINAKTLGNLIEEILSDDKKLELISQAALKRAEDFSINQFNRDIVKFYEMLINRYNS